MVSFRATGTSTATSNSCGESAPELRYLPSNLWLIGLGHLGQAYLWGLGLLPYASDAKVGLVLQDVDVITPSTESTSILSDSTMLRRKKTRVTAAWAEPQGGGPTAFSARDRPR